jgi:hypothetical protein
LSNALARAIDCSAAVESLHSIALSFSLVNTSLAFLTAITANSTPNVAISAIADASSALKLTLGDSMGWLQILVVAILSLISKYRLCTLSAASLAVSEASAAVCTSGCNCASEDASLACWH